MQLNAWDEPVDSGTSLKIVNDLARSHACDGGAVGETLRQLIDAEDYLALATFELDPTSDWDVYQLLQCRQALAFYQKYEDLNLGIDKEAVAHQKFIASESACAVMNSFFESWYGGLLCPVPGFVLVLEKARRLIHHLLGRCPDVSELKLRFGPGATTSTRRTDANPTNKFARGLQCSKDLYTSGLLPSLLRELPHWTANLESRWSIDEEDWLCETLSVDLHPGKLSFVPKNAKTNRSILVEPVLNSMLQSGIGAWMKRRLRIAGIDITDQTRNAELARRGSITNDLATLDLSSASDLISIELVRFLLPDSWYTLLSAARTGEAVYKRSPAMRLEKFSSMGNGFTFPLETLIFWSITRATCEGASDQDIGVYGDDIVCPVKWVSDVIRNLVACGFSVNTEKSFVRGPFRESCGHDYYRGINVRPYYQRKLVSAETLFTLHNFYYRSGEMERAERVVGLIPRPLRLYGPDGYGDGHLLAEQYLDRTSPKMRKKGMMGTRFETFSKVPRRCITRYPGDYVSPLYSVYIKDRSDVHPLISGVFDSTPVGFSESGLPLWAVPGDRGYKRVLIYTLG